MSWGQGSSQGWQEGEGEESRKGRLGRGWHSRALQHHLSLAAGSKAEAEQRAMLRGDAQHAEHKV